MIVSGSITITVGGVATNADALPVVTSCVPTATTSVAVGATTGLYAITISNAVAGQSYVVSGTAVVSGVAYSWSTTISEKASAAEMVALLTNALKANPIGVVTITIDGNTTTYDRKQAIAELQFWKQQAAQESGKRRRAASIDLSGF